MADDKAMVELVKEMRQMALPNGVLNYWAGRLESLIQPEMKLKPKQVLVHNYFNTIIRCRAVNAQGFLECETWLGGKWEPSNVSIYSMGEYVPWPRVGDWVRCIGCTHAVSTIWQVAKVDEGFAHDADGSRHFLKDLEPASSPSEFSKYELSGVRQPSEFTGAHWDKMRSGEMLRFGDKVIQKCFADVCEAVEELRRGKPA